MEARGTPERSGLLYQTHALPDGLSVRLRLARSSDGDLVRELLESCSPESLQLRFFASMPVIPERAVHHFTRFDPRHRTVVCATVPGEGREQLLGLGDLSAEGDQAEGGVIVADRVQGRGLGGLLTAALVADARRRGLRALRARLLTRNLRMRKALGRLGSVSEGVEDGHSVLTLELAEPGQLRRAA